MVSIAGPYRKGKSYILSEAFNQPEVFPLGHEMVAETMGIWLWIVPGKYKVNNRTIRGTHDPSVHFDDFGRAKSPLNFGFSCKEIIIKFSSGKTSA